MIGKKYRFRNDKFKVDIDFVLQNLLVERIVWIDNRYYAINKKDNNVGGNSKYRTEAEFNRSVDSLEEKWGDCLKIKRNRYGSQMGISLNVKRKQVINYD